MKHSLIAFSLLAIPTVAFALDFSNGSSVYADSSSFTTAERAGINVLTNLKAVSGNPDGTFAARRTLNRAEFLKIVLSSVPQDRAVPEGALPPGDQSVPPSAPWCFPDVKAGDWFMPYVCSAKENDVVQGYPDGTFKPGNAVNYAEALKILTEVYRYELPTPGPTERWAWYTAYLRAAASHAVLLPEDPALDTLLTRGQMARLAASYRAEHEGDLSEYRARESGTYSYSSKSSVSSSSSASSVSSQSGSSVSSAPSSVSSSSSSSMASQAAVYPATSHFLVAGTTTPVIIDGLFNGGDEDAVLRRATVLFRRELKSFSSLILVDDTGKEVATLTLATSNNTDNRRFEAVIVDDRLRIGAGKSPRLGFKAVLKNRDMGGVTNELVEVESVNIDVQGVTSGESRQIVPTDTHYPMHQTTHGRVLSVRNSSTAVGALQAGQDTLLATFSISGMAVTGATLSLKNLEFILQKSNVSATHIRIGGSSSVQQADCGLEQQATILLVTCPVIPDAYQTVGMTPTVLSIYADIAVADSGTTGSLQLLFEGRGKIGQNGALRWSDGTATFNWIEADVLLENGTQWTVTK